MIARRRGTDNPIRIIGLSTALANAVDIADWLGVPEVSTKIDQHVARLYL